MNKRQPTSTSGSQAEPAGLKDTPPTQTGRKGVNVFNRPASADRPRAAIISMVVLLLSIIIGVLAFWIVL